MAVSFRVPYNLNLKSNEYTVGVFDISCNLYTEMSKKNGLFSVKGQEKGPSLTHKGQ